MKDIYLLQNEDGDILGAFATETLMDEYMREKGANRIDVREYRKLAHDNTACNEWFYGTIVPFTM